MNRPYNKMLMRFMLSMVANFGNDFRHIRLLCQHICRQLDLGTGALQILLGMGGLEIQITVQIVLQEAGRQLQCDDKGAQGQHFHLFFRLIGGAGQESFRVHPEQMQIQMGILTGFAADGSAETDGVTKIIQAEAGHHGV